MRDRYVGSGAVLHEVGPLKPWRSGLCARLLDLSSQLVASTGAGSLTAARPKGVVAA